MYSTIGSGTASQATPQGRDIPKGLNIEDGHVGHWPSCAQSFRVCVLSGLIVLSRSPIHSPPAGPIEPESGALRVGCGWGCSAGDHGDRVVTATGKRNTATVGGHGD
jgi:hypothetical protein